MDTRDQAAAIITGILLANKGGRGDLALSYEIVDALKKGGWEICRVKNSSVVPPTS